MSDPKKPRKKAKTSASSAGAQADEEQRALALYAAKMATLAEMAGGIAHEINTPLAVILTLSSQIREMLEEGDVDKQIFLSSMSTIEKTTVKIANIISGLRTFARDAAHEQTTDVELRKLIDETMSFCRERFLNRGVRLEYNIPDPTLMINCNFTQISQVLLNILQNCHDSLMKLANRWIRIEVRETGGNLELRITDSGPGIPESHRDKIFRPFFTTKEVGQGPGLGLSVSRSIVESHGGTLVLDEKNPNTSFVMTLPLKAKSRAA